MTTVATPHN